MLIDTVSANSLFTCFQTSFETFYDLIVMLDFVIDCFSINFKKRLTLQ